MLGRQHYSAAADLDDSAPIWDHGDIVQGRGRYAGSHDPVTGLPSPRRFLEHLEQLLATPARSPRPLAMLLLEVAVANVPGAPLGQECGDELLRIVAERLHEEVPEAKLLTRLGGGNFAIVLHDLGPEVTAEALATRLLERASEPWPSGEGSARCAVVGALTFSASSGETVMPLLARALRVLNRAKLRSGSHAC